jgi:hypothetical protein
MLLKCQEEEMRLGLLIFLILYVSISSGFTQESVRTCLLYGPSYQLASDTVEWSMSVGSGQGCIRGIRGAYNTIDSISLTVPPHAGQVKLEGPGFLYRANGDFKGQDSFAIVVSGKLNNVNGSSTIVVRILVR